MIKKIMEKKFIYPSIVTLIILFLIIDFLAPAEQTLGRLVKLIYIHAAINWVGMVLFTLAGILGLAYIVSRKISLYSFSLATEKAAVLIWAIHSVIGAISMKIVWNEFYWAEPRMAFAFTVLFIGVIGLLVSVLFNNKAVTSLLNLGVAAFLWVLLFKTGRVLHPPAAISGSSQWDIRIYAGLMTLVLFLAALQVSRLLYRKE